NQQQRPENEASQQARDQPADIEPAALVRSLIPFFAALRIGPEGSDRHRRDEAVAVAGNRFDEARACRVITQRIPQAGHCTVEPFIKFHESVRGPDTAAELLAADDFAVGFEKQLKYFEGLLLQLDLDALFAQFALLQIEFEDAELHKFRVSVLGGHGQNTKEDSTESLTPRV